MGQQQLLLLVLGVLIVGVAIVVGIDMFYGNSIQANKDALINDLNNLSSDAYTYYARARMMGGGSGSYSGYVVNVSYASTDNGDITQQIAPDGRSVTFTATSRHGYGTIQAVLNDVGQLTSITYSGDFH